MIENLQGDSKLARQEAPLGDPEKEALINKLAREMVSSKDVLGSQAAPDSLVGKYGLVTLKGLGKVPAGMLHAAEDSVKNPLQTLEMIGGAAAMGVVLKTVLPETGSAGKIAGAVLGAYFTYKAAEPMVNAYKQAGQARSMADLDRAATQIGDIGGQFIVHSAISAVGYKLGAAGAERVLLSEKLDGFANAKQAFWDGVGDKSSKIAGRLTDAIGMSSTVEPVKLSASLSLDSQVPGTKRFMASERPAPEGSLKGPVDPNAAMEITVQLKSKASDLAMDRALKRIALGRQNPLSDAEFAEKFGASQESLTEVSKFAKDNGLQVAQADMRSGRVVLAGTTSKFSQAFQTNLSEYDVHGLSVRGRQGALAVPNALTSHIEGVFGIDDRPQAHFYSKVLPGDAGANNQSMPRRSPADAATTKAGEVPAPGKVADAPAPGSGPIEPKKATGYMPNEVADAYEFPKGTTGKGQNVAIIQLGGGVDLQNEAAYYKAHGLKMPEIKVIEVNGAKSKVGINPGADGEVSLDSQVVGAVAPDAKQSLIFTPNNDRGFIDAITRATFPERGENPNQAISISWGAPMESWTEQGKRGMNLAFKKAALKGISVFAAAGDDGAMDASPSRTFQVDYPAADPYVTGAGGTRLTIRNGRIGSEVAWNNGEGRGAGGGGISPDAVPDYQKGLSMPDNANRTGIPGRGVPDIAGNADPVTGYRIRVGGSESIIGGTSAVAPLYAALAVRLNEGLGGGRQVGFMNPFLYKHGMAGNAPFFNDITSGNNNGYNTGPTWDAVTGWGSVNGEKLLAAYKSEGQSLALKALSRIPVELANTKDVVPLPINVRGRDQNLKSG